MFLMGSKLEAEGALYEGERHGIPNDIIFVLNIVSSKNEPRLFIPHTIL